MKKSIQWVGRFMLVLASALIIQLPLLAQDKIVVDKEEVGNWFQQNWIWVAGGVLLIVLIALFSGGRSKRKSTTTTVVKDQFGDTRRVTTTEVES